MSIASRATLRGFTLIELMIVVAIIAVLATVALPGLQNQVARAQATAGLAELRALVGPYEDLLMRDARPFDLAALGLEASGNETTSTRCELLMTPPDSSTAAGALQCTLRGHPRVSGDHLTLIRDGELGRWRCVTSVVEALAPSGCEVLES
jgi:type IV pilus assembly protein PilA